MMMTYKKTREKEEKINQNTYKILENVSFIFRITGYKNTKIHFMTMIMNTFKPFLFNS